jgi:hypothetical protein
MSAGLVAQYVIIALLVVISVLYTARRLAPRIGGRWQAAVAAELLRPGRAAFAQRVGRMLQPRGASGSCGGGCGPCGGCGSSGSEATAASGEQPLTFRPPRT